MSVLRSSIETAAETGRGHRLGIQNPSPTGPFRKAVLARLADLKTGRLVLTDADQTYEFGTTGDQRETISAAIEVRNPKFYRNTVLGGSLGAAESYLAGDWQTDDLLSVLQLIARNRRVLEQVNGGTAQLLSPLRRLWNLARANSRRGSRQNIAAHYDLGNDFFRLFLDPTMTYSSGIFTGPECSMLDASLNKFDRICRKLQLSSDDHVLEIGTGWGGFAIYAAQQYKCRVTTTTISAEQFKVAQQRIEQAGVQDRVTLLQRDYRDLEGQFDKLVSIEMIEAVGHRFLPTFFRKCSQLLNRDGLMSLQAITIPDQRHRSYRQSVDFIQRYIFPGGCLPSMQSMLAAITRSADLLPIHYETFASHYARTLAIWRSNFHQNLTSARALNDSDFFLRAWEYYLCYCEAGFRERQVDVCQLVLAKPECRGEIAIAPLPRCEGNSA